MAEEHLNSFRLSLMEDLLPVGLAVLERARQGGPKSVAEVFRDSDDPLQRLRKEGEPSAKSLRDRLDQVRPGLGNPVVPVTVEVDINPESFQGEDSQDQEILVQVLSRIRIGLDVLESNLDLAIGDDSASQKDEG